MLLGAKQPSIQENTAETGVGTVDQTAPAPVFCFSAVKQAQYFSRFFTEQRSWQNSTRRDLNHKQQATSQKKGESITTTPVPATNEKENLAETPSPDPTTQPDVTPDVDTPPVDDGLTSTQRNSINMLNYLDKDNMLKYIELCIDKY